MRGVSPCRRRFEKRLDVRNINKLSRLFCGEASIVR
jgi:hypothetical protein